MNAQPEPTASEPDRDAILKKIRKLVRLAATPGPEGENARVRADELMAKHTFTAEEVSPDGESFRLVVEHIASEFWREQLCFAAANTRKCKLMLGTQKAAHLAALLGEKKQVEAAFAHYQVLAAQLELECKHDWAEFVRINTPPYHGGFDHIFRVPEIISVWTRLYLINAAQTVRNRMSGAAVPPPPESADDDVPMPAPVRRVVESKKAAEEEKTERDLNALEQILGVEGAEALQVTAWHRGMDLGNSISVEDGTRAAGARRLTG